MTGLIKKISAVLFIFSLISSLLIAQISIPDDLNTQIPKDPAIRKGKFDNGLTYYIKQNSQPKNRAELHLVVNAGSILEDDDQQGLAHFCEHMAFNGTENFQKHALINFLESIGMKFGAELNAYTGFDETVYMLTVPLDKKEFLDTAFMILRDWASVVSYEGEEIDKERGVIQEEWRLGQGAEDRMSRQYLPVIYHDSKYANRLPIGKLDIIKNAPYDKLRSFYKEWYRPNLMAVVAVGDFDADQIESYIKKYFEGLKNPTGVRERTVFDIPDHDKPLVSIVSDKENPYSLVQVFYKIKGDNSATHLRYRNSLTQSLYVQMLSNRINEIMEAPNPPFLYAGSVYTSFSRTKDAFLLIGVAKNNRNLESFERLLVENERIKRYGFTQTELDRTKAEFLRNMEKLLKEKDQQKSVNLASEYTRNFLKNESIPGIEYEYEMYKKFLPSIQLKEVNDLSRIFGTPENAVIVMTFPEKKEVKIPKEKEVLKIFNSISKKTDITPYEDKVSDEPLISEMPESSPVVSENPLPVYDAVEWTLKNGVKVIVKKTDFKNDEILMTAFSFGGTSQYAEVDDISASFTDAVIENSGLGNFENTELQKMLSGKIVSVSPYISQLTEGITGSSSPADFESLMQLTYLYFTSPRKDATAYENYITSQKDQLLNQVSPEQAFQDTIAAVMANYHKRGMPLKLEDIDKANHDRIMNIYRERFGDASDFTFIFVGNIDPATAKPLIEQYLGGLPTKGTKENFVDLGIRQPDKSVNRVVKKGTEPKATVFLTFPSKMEYNYINSIKLQLAAEILNIRLREVIREDEGGVYGIQAWASASPYPVNSSSLGVYFGCAPENVDKFIDIVKSEIAVLQKDGSNDINLNKVKESALRDREKNLIENRFWLNAIRNYYMYKINPDDFTNYNNIVKNVNNDDIKNYAKSYIDLNKMIRVVLMPEK